MVTRKCAFNAPFSIPHSYRPLYLHSLAPVPRALLLPRTAAFVAFRDPSLHKRGTRNVITAALSRAEHAYIFQRSPYNHFRERLYASRRAGAEVSSPVVPDGDSATQAAPPPGEELTQHAWEEGGTHGADRFDSAKLGGGLLNESFVSSEIGNGDYLGEDGESGGVASVKRSGSLHFDTHEELMEALYALKGDPLEKDGGRIVVYRGNPKARLMIIGEAPGAQEDRQGKPFVGDAGKLLDKIFAYGGFDMERQVYVTNVAKRRPRGNRTPTDKEVEFYLPYLKEEIRLIRPKVIVLAGGSAARAILGPDARITKIRGDWLNYDGHIAMMAVYHPAYLLRKPVAKYDMVVDIEEIRAKYLVEVPDQVLKPLVKKT